MNWNQVTVKQYQEFHDYCTENDEKDLYQYDLNSISFFEDMPIDEIEDLSIEEFNSLRRKYLFARNYPLPNNKAAIEISGITLHFINDFNKISIGEYIDLDHFFSKESGGFTKNLGVILAICYRQKENINPLLYEDKFEKYDTWIHRRASLFDSIPIQDVYGILLKFQKFKDDLKKSYPNLLVTIEDESDIDFSKMTRREALEIKEELEYDKSVQQFGWELFLYTLSKMNNCSFEQATEMPMMLAFGLYSMKIAFKIQV